MSKSPKLVAPDYRGYSKEQLNEYFQQLNMQTFIDENVVYTPTKALSIEETASNLNIKVKYSKMRVMEGFLFSPWKREGRVTVANGWCVVLDSELRSADERQFVFAHELGHLAINKHRKGDELNPRCTMYEDLVRPGRSSLDENPITEATCDYFASVVVGAECVSRLVAAAKVVQT